MHRSLKIWTGGDHIGNSLDPLSRTEDVVTPTKEGEKHLGGQMAEKLRGNYGGTNLIGEPPSRGCNVP